MSEHLPNDLLASNHAQNLLERTGKDKIGIAFNLITDSYSNYDNFLNTMPNKFKNEYGLFEEFPCKKGCSSCCYLPVQVIEPEIIAIISLIHEKYGVFGIKKYAQKAISAAEKISGYLDEDRKNISVACPFLESGSCAVYERRPFACRAYISTSLEACNLHKEDPLGNHSTHISKTAQTQQKLYLEHIFRVSKILGIKCGVFDLIEISESALRDPDRFAKNIQNGNWGMGSTSKVYSYGSLADYMQKAFL